MATRRSRLQIKPNILGGPKGPSSKPAPKSSAKTANNEELDAAMSESGNKVKSPTRITSPRRHVTISPLKEAGSEKIVKDEKSAESEAASKNDGKSVPEKESEKMENEDSKKSGSPNLPARARLRRFGKVNISAARGVKQDSRASKNDEKSDQENSTSKPKSESPKATDVEKKDGSIREKEDLDKVVKESSGKNSSQASENTLTQRRSRFPKAKPNIADASRRKQKESAPKEDAANSRVVDNSAPSIPEITVTDVSSNENDTMASSAKHEFTPHSDSPHALTKIQPRLSATPIPIPKSPLKHPTPTIPVSPEKRTRSLSISEPPVVKRQRKPKVDAPTDKPPDRATMKIRDLIRWNPSSNPMKPKIRNTDAIVSGIEKENIVKKVAVGVGDKIVASVQEAADTALPVPQVTIGPDGNIVINEKSLIVNEQDHEKVSSQEEEVIDETDVFTTYGSFRKRNMSKRWSKKDTKKFYKALAMIGIDFFLISQLFPDRTRLEIKKKFKKEEKVNRALVEKVLKERIQFDPTVFDVQEKEESSSEEEDDNEPKKKKGGKRGPKKRGQNSKLSQQTPAVRKAVKSRKRAKNYFEDYSTDDEEELLEKKSLCLDGPWQPPSVSQKDGEVVGILMDMSEGRITGEGQGQEGVMNVMEVSSEDTYRSDKLIAVPISNAPKGRGFIPIEPKNVNPNSEMDVNMSSNAHSRTVRNIPAIPGIQSINIMEADQTARTAMNLPAQSQSVSRQQSALNNSNRQIVLPFLNKTSAMVSETETRQNINLYNQQVQFEQNNILNNEMQTEISQNQLDIGTSHSQSQVGTSQSQLQVETSQNPEPVSTNDTEEADQYMLVTVVPEDGGETIIHIYRMHGGTQSQNQIMYADPYSSQQLTLDSTIINNSFSQSQNLTNTNCIPPNEAQLPLAQSETPLDSTLTPKTRSDISEMADGSLSASTSQETVGNCSTSLTNENSKVTVSDDMIPVMKDDVQLSYEPVSTDLTSQSTFTQMILNEKTSAEDSECNLTLTSGNTKPEVYLSNAASGDGKFRNELEYEVENC